MKKRFGKQFLCYLLSVTLFASVLQVPVGALQVSPQDGTKQSVENKTDSSEITSDTTSVRKEEKTLDFALNGGSFIEGYQSPSSYPADKLPDGSVISKPGYAFAGWYDNKEFSGEAVTKIDTSYKGPLVLYAKWMDPYYYVDIPANVKADGSELKLSGAADGLYEQEVVKVSVNSENNWHLKNHDALLSYQLKEKDTKLIPENGVPVINLTSTKKSDEKVYVCEVTEDPQTAGEYQDTLTFEIGHESPSYTINYEANGGFKDDPKIRAVSFPLKKRHLRRARPLVICRLPSSPVIHFSAGAMTRAAPDMSQQQTACCAIRHYMRLIPKIRRSSRMRSLLLRARSM